VNRTTGKDQKAMGQPIEIDSKDLEQRIYIAFPEPGEYELGLAAKGAGDVSYTDFAMVQFSVTVSARSPIPAPWEITPYFRKYHLAIESSPPAAVGEELSIVLAVPPSWDGSVYLSGKKSSASIGTVSSELQGTKLVISALLPRSDEYTLSVSGRIDSKESSRQVAQARFVATVDPAAASYRLWRSKGTWPRLPVQNVQSVAESWSPLGDYPVFKPYRKSVAAQDFTVVSAQGPIPVKQGSPVSFANQDYHDETAVDAVAVTLAKDISVTAYGAPFSFKAGTALSVGEHELAGAITKDARVTLDGNALLVPKGSRLYLEDDRIGQIDLATASSLTVAGKQYACEGQVLIEDYGEQGDLKLVRLMTAKDYAVKIGTTSFTLARGSLLMFRGPRIERVIFQKDTAVTLNGAAESVATGWGLEFDALGAAKKVQAE
jgi:hypothetical protein